jgi:hypothetical protein
LIGVFVEGAQPGEFVWWEEQGAMYDLEKLP